ncbi:hypothetical protein EBI_25875 [Enterocytozoon bieneusi H348]|nr:hypothetical protein EBI_25875 [Enterocytozoon bieneusi H348]|eukprot:XP_001827995.1 hypothetical protein EBI_25875 [Enterocytozoon bieneusi H348]
MYLREQTKTGIFTFSIIVLILVSGRITIFMNNSIGIVNQLYDPLSLTIIVTCLFINFGLGVLGLFIIMGFNNFLTRNLPNTIGCQEKAKILAISVVINGILMACINIKVLFKTKIVEIDNKLIYWLLGLFISQILCFYSCWLVHSDFFNLEFKQFKTKVISNRTQHQNLFV